MLYAILMAFCKLRHYFHAHKITVVTSCPLAYILQNREGMECTVKWAIELVEIGLQYAPNMRSKSQVLADFIVKWTLVPDIKCLEETATPAVACNEPWTTAT